MKSGKHTNVSRFYKRIMKKLILSALLLLSLVFSLCSCEKQKEHYSKYSFDYFDTVTSISGYASSQEEFDEVYTLALEMLSDYHRLFTIYHRFANFENLCTINERVDGKHRVVTVDARVIEMLTYAKNAYEMTDGTLNIAMGSVLKLWHDERELGADDPVNAALPSMTALKEAALHTNINDVIIDEEAGTVFISDPALTLDVGAVAKGYAVEMIARTLEEMGVDGYVLNVGGNVRTIGKKANGDAWTVGIENPNKESDVSYLAYLSLSGEALVTSGSYQRYYIVDGEKYHHIIDPDTLFPSDKYTSVSVVCKSSADADVLSTALFCMDIDEGMALIEKTEGAESMWLLTDGKIVKSSGFSQYEIER